MRIVRCNFCGRWIGRDEDVGLYYNTDTEYCPECKCMEALMDVDYGCKFTDWELEQLWELFGDIPVDDNENILEEFLSFPEGTDRMEIWYWFDEQYSKGIVCLIFSELSA